MRRALRSERARHVCVRHGIEREQRVSIAEYVAGMGGGVNGSVRLGRIESCTECELRAKRIGGTQRGKRDQILCDGARIAALSTASSISRQGMGAGAWPFNVSAEDGGL